MARDMAKDFNSNDTYTISGKTLDVDGSKFTILEDGKKIQMSEEGITLTFNRKK